VGIKNEITSKTYSRSLEVLTVIHSEVLRMGEAWGTWAEGSRLTNWATQAPLCSIFQKWSIWWIDLCLICPFFLYFICEKIQLLSVEVKFHWQFVFIYLFIHHHAHWPHIVIHIHRCSILQDKYYLQTHGIYILTWEIDIDRYWYY